MKTLFYNISICLSLFLVASCIVEEDETAPVNPPPPSVNNGLVAYFSFEGNADDLSGNNFHGSVQGARPTADRFGNQNGAYLFDGTDDFISLGNVEEMSFGGAETYTMAAWVRVDSTERTNIIVSKWNGGVLAGWYMGVTNERKAIAYRNVVPWTSSTEEEVTADEFVHLIASYDGETRELMLYINGELLATQPFRTQPHDRRTPVLIGALHSRNEVANFYQGVIDDIRIYDRLLNEEEITYLSEN